MTKRDGEHYWLGPSLGCCRWMLVDDDDDGRRNDHACDLDEHPDVCLIKGWFSWPLTLAELQFWVWNCAACLARPFDCRPPVELIIWLFNVWAACGGWLLTGASLRVPGIFADPDVYFLHVERNLLRHGNIVYTTRYIPGFPAYPKETLTGVRIEPRA